jgi:hypothetical protein
VQLDLHKCTLPPVAGAETGEAGATGQAFTDVQGMETFFRPYQIDFSKTLIGKLLASFQRQARKCVTCNRQNNKVGIRIDSVMPPCLRWIAKKRFKRPLKASTADLATCYQLINYSALAVPYNRSSWKLGGGSYWEALESATRRLKLHVGNHAGGVEITPWRGCMTVWLAWRKFVGVEWCRAPVHRLDTFGMGAHVVSRAELPRWG